MRQGSQMVPSMRHPGPHEEEVQHTSQHHRLRLSALGYRVLGLVILGIVMG